MARLYLGNIPFKATDSEIRNFLSPHKVTEVKIMLDRETQRPRGFAFAELAPGENVDEVVRKYDGVQLGGRSIKVSEANPRQGAPGGPRRDSGPPRHDGGRSERSNDRNGYGGGNSGRRGRDRDFDYDRD